MKPVEFVDAEVVQAREPDESGQRRKGVIEQLLSPKSLQRMMGVGGGFLVLGFVVWLWTIGMFDNPATIAAILGGTTLGVMGGGIALVRFTRYQLAGRGLALLGALALPLNLWFYDAQGLITVAGGGHLWIPAAICCAIYALVARVLRDANFVYALVGGIVLTGMLFLADQQVNHFWKLMPPVTFLVATGWLCMFGERQFMDGDGDFARGKFGLAFYRAGLVVLTSGLVLLLGGQLAWMVQDILWLDAVPLATLDPAQKIWATGIVLVSAAGFAFEYFSRGSKSRYAVAAMGLGAWAVVSVLDIFTIRPEVGHVAILAGLAVTAGNFLFGQVRKVRGQAADEISTGSNQWLQNAVAICLGLGVVALAQFTGQFFCGPGNLFIRQAGWLPAIQMLVTSLAIFTTAFRMNRDRFEDEISLEKIRMLVFGGAVISSLAMWTAGLALGTDSFVVFAGLGMIMPIGAAIGSLVTKEGSIRRGMQLVASVSVSTLLLCLVSGTIGEFLELYNPSLSWAVLLSVCTAICMIAAMGKRAGVEWGAGIAIAGFAVWQWMSAFGIENSYAFAIAPTLIGAGLIGFRQLMERRDGATESGGISTLALTGNILVLAGNLFGALLTFNRFMAGETAIGLLAVLAIQLVATAVVSLMTREREWRSAFRVSAITTVGAALLVIHGLLDTHWLNRAELCSLLAGAALLVIGHLAWSREGEKEDGMATASLTVGSLLMTVPLAIGLVVYRLMETGAVGNWMLFHEIGAVVVALALLGAGLLCQIRATTVSGCGLMTVHILSLAILVRWPSQLQSVSVVMMIGGGLFFGTAILLSIYRDRIVKLPSKIREGEGMFRVLKWR